ncbi:hypothetical protein FOZ63_033751 [Perkinsus olseni]|uniref:Uncharacterized protein n=1 Tax=Perkinsus olseni TaxID=32597 RepID=A0A7J6Q6M8_PEROL|nr:hypothetical protein FOZ62_030279 [Perkinsus olseni]KAF4727364.1 hypothetical protein FOZ63_033751 [Perkinsus olseni]
MIVLFAMYAYEFFISSVITGVTEVWTAMLLISLDLLENLYYIYCIYRAAYPFPSRDAIRPAPPNSRKSDPRGEADRNRDQQPSHAEPTPGSNIDGEHPANGSRRTKQVSENYEPARKEPQKAQLPALESELHLNGSDERGSAVSCGNSDVAPTAKLENSLNHLSQYDSNFSPVLPLSKGSAAAIDGLAISGRNPDGEQSITDDPPRSGGGIARRRSSMSTLSSFTSMLETKSVLEGTVRSFSDECSLPRRRDGSHEVISSSTIEANNRQLSRKDGNFDGSFSILAIAICKEVVEVVAPMHYLVCSCVLRTFNPKLHDIFWDMTDEEFWQGIWRLSIEIVAEASLFIVIIIAMKRWLNESVTSIALRLGYHFSWPFAALQVSLMTYFITLQYSNSGMLFSFDFKWIGEKNTTWHGGNCYTTGNETAEEVC